MRIYRIKPIAVGETVTFEIGLETVHEDYSTNPPTETTAPFNLALLVGVGDKIEVAVREDTSEDAAYLLAPSSTVVITNAALGLFQYTLAKTILAEEGKGRAFEVKVTYGALEYYPLRLLFDTFLTMIRAA